ncbi:MAG: hypothetical protein AABY37_00935, partial [Actinomycetota bacterium]
SARKHRIGKQRALSVIDANEPFLFIREGFETELLKWIGFDDRGLELEIVAVPLVDHLLVIHVMPFRFRRER